MPYFQNCCTNITCLLKFTQGLQLKYQSYVLHLMLITFNVFILIYCTYLKVITFTEVNIIYRIHILLITFTAFNLIYLIYIMQPRIKTLKKSEDSIDLLVVEIVKNNLFQHGNLYHSKIKTRDFCK